MKKQVMLFVFLFNYFFCYTQSFSTETISVPVIFHVIYSNRLHSSRIDGGNTTENIETAKLLKELQGLHEDFLSLNTDKINVVDNYKKIIGNPNVNFYLADTILQTGGEKGIIRIMSEQNKRNLFKYSPVVKPSKYLNIYIGNIGNIGNSFVYSKSWNNPLTDAVYLSFDWVGLNYRLLTHETGHWCGLLHIFGGAGSKKGSGCKKDGDGISDTPIQKRATDISCVKCPPLIIDQTCDKKIISNYNNFMDYSGCRKMFTIDQSKLIRETISIYRTSLLTNRN